MRKCNLLKFIVIADEDALFEVGIEKGFGYFKLSAMFLSKVGNSECFHCVATSSNIKVEVESNFTSEFVYFFEHLVCAFWRDVFVCAESFDGGHSVIGRCVWINAESVKFYSYWFLIFLY